MKGSVALLYGDCHVFTTSHHIGDRGGLLSTLVSIGERFHWFGRDLLPTTYVRVAQAWRGRAAAGGRVALGRAVAKRGILAPTQM